MKKICLILVFCALALVGSAQSQPRRIAKVAQLVEAKEAVAEEETPIKTQPEGVLYDNMYRYSYFWYNDYGFALDQVYDGVVSKLVVDDEGSVYIHRPFTGMGNDVWVKAYKAEGDTVVIKSHQYFMTAALDEYSDPSKLYIESMVQGEYEWEYEVDPEGHDIKFVWRNDSLIKVDNYLMGLVDESGEWALFGEDDLIISSIKTPVAVPGDAAEYAEYNMTVSIADDVEDGFIIKGALDGSNIYLSGIEGMPADAWIVGKINGDEVVFDSYQYLGATKKFHRFFCPITVDSKGNMSFADNLTFSLDRSTMTMKSDGSFVINEGVNTLDGFSVVFVYQYPVITPSTDEAATPVDPEIIEFVPYNEKYGFASFEFNIYKVGTNGAVLKEEDLYYNIFINDELFTFEKPDYKHVPGPMTDVPYSYHDRDFEVFDSYNHTLYFYSADIDKIGVQLCYKHGDQVYKSRIMSVPEDPVDGLNSVVDDSVQSVEYFDMYGRKIENPQNGLYIMKVNTADGRYSTSKVLMR